jgi:glycine/D-amino acid oxidase-like deaminating enzyme
MRIAIIGAGFAGLSVAWHLEEGHEVVIFDPKGVGGGASGVAAGLLHPYVGEEGKRSLHALEALQAATSLIETVQTHLQEQIVYPGLIRHLFTKEMQERFVSHGNTYKDVTRLDEERFWISSGMTVDCPRYLEGLWQLLTKKGVTLVLRSIQDLQELSHFDKVVVAAGAGVKALLPSLPLSFVKGQVVLCRVPEGVALPEVSSHSKGYLALLKDQKICTIGSTYERQEVDETPHLSFTLSYLLPKIKQFFPEVERLEPLECKAAVRVIRKGDYFPLLAKVQDRVWVITAFGSRGLLYHALLGKMMGEYDTG